MKPISEEVAQFIALERAMPIEKILPKARLYHDLEIYGDDAVEMLDAFSKKFNVDFSEFDFHKYFTGEPSLATSLILLSEAINRPRGKSVSLLPITVEDLIRAAEVGKWSDPRELPD